MLNTRVGPGSVEGNELVADNVVAGSERRGNSELVGLVGDKVVGGPGAVLTLAFVMDFEPDGAGYFVSGLLFLGGLDRETHAVPGL